MKYLEHALVADEKVFLLPVSDLHLGNEHCLMSKLNSYLKWAKESGAYLILNGDLFNLDEQSKFGETDTLNYNEQLDLACELFSPFKDKILSIVEGNHEFRMRKKSFDIMHEFCMRLGLIHLFDRSGIMLKLSFGKDMHGRPVKYFVYHIHGVGGGRLPGAKVNNLNRMSESVPLCDVYIASHTHFMTGDQDIIYLPNERGHRIDEMKRTYVSSGSFLGWGGYAERGLFPATKSGSPRIRLDATRKDVHFSI